MITSDICHAEREAIIERPRIQDEIWPKESFERPIRLDSDYGSSRVGDTTMSMS